MLILPAFGSIYGATATPAAVAPVDPVVPVLPVLPPNAGETAWTLGLGGAVVAPRVAAGADLRLATTLKNAGQALGFPAGTTLAAEVTRGGTAGTIPTAVPAVAWVDPARPAAVALALAAAQTATLDAGEYALRVFVVLADGTRLTAFDGRLVVDPQAAADSEAPAWATQADLRRLSPALGRLLDKQGQDTEGFLSVRQSVTAELLRALVLAYDPRIVKRRGPTVDPIVLSFDVRDPTIVPPTPRQWAGYLSSGLVLEETLRDAVARRSIAEVLDRQQGNAYEAEAAMHRQKADAMLANYWPQVDADGDGIPDYLAGPSGKVLIYLPVGTSP